MRGPDDIVSSDASSRIRQRLRQLGETRIFLDRIPVGVGMLLNERQRTASNDQRGSRTQRPPEALALWRRYSV